MAERRREVLGMLGIPGGQGGCSLCVKPVVSEVTRRRGHAGWSRSHREALRAIRDRWPGRTVIIRNQRQLDAFYRPMA